MVISEKEYMKKIRAHKKMTEEDLKQFIFDQIRALDIEDYVEEVNFTTLFQAIAGYSIRKKTVNLDKKSRRIVKKEFFDVREDKLIALKKMIVCNFSDFYNLYMIFVCFHELIHAVQEKRIAEEDSFFSLLIKCSQKFMRASGSVYATFHDKYYIEYNANMNAIKLTLNFIETHFKECFGKGTLVLLNKTFVDYILDGYGINNQNNSVNKLFPSPIEFFKYFIYHDEYFTSEWPIEITDKPLIDKLKIFIEEVYPSLIKNDISDLLNGYEIPPKVLAKLILIKKDDIKTTNFLEEVEREFEIGNKKK